MSPILNIPFCSLSNILFLFSSLHDKDAVVLALKSEIKNLENTIMELEQTNQVCVVHGNQNKVIKFKDNKFISDIIKFLFKTDHLCN